MTESRVAVVVIVTTAPSGRLREEVVVDDEQCTLPIPSHNARHTYSVAIVAILEIVAYCIDCTQPRHYESTVD